jgi:hypothetical protein
VGSLLNDAERKAICHRIGSVTSASVPRWGRMDAKAVLTHLKRSALMALGELPVACKSKRVFQVFPIKHRVRRTLWAERACTCWLRWQRPRFTHTSSRERTFSSS